MVGNICCKSHDYYSERNWHPPAACVEQASLGMGSPARQARPGPKISGLGRVFWPDGRAWAAEMRPDSLLGPGLGSKFRGFREGPAWKPDGPIEKSLLGPGLGRFFRPDSQAGLGLGSHFQFRALSWSGPTRPGPRGCPGIGTSHTSSAEPVLRMRSRKVGLDHFDLTMPCHKKYTT
jgi:hypothetical protein